MRHVLRLAHALKSMWVPMGELVHVVRAQEGERWHRVGVPSVDARKKKGNSGVEGHERKRR